jgi:CheY-like chemotaxis protein
VAHQTLLLADDSVTIQRVIELTFADEDIHVVAVSDGEQAISALDRHPPDIVLADIGMPGRSGYEVAEHIRVTPHLAHIPVLLLTGAFEPVDQAKVASVGCDGVLAKPFEPQLVISRVRELLARPRQPGSTFAGPPALAPLDEAPAWRPHVGPEDGVPAAVSDLDAYFERLDQAFTMHASGGQGESGRGAGAADGGGPGAGVSYASPEPEFPGVVEVPQFSAGFTPETLHPEGDVDSWDPTPGPGAFGAFPTQAAPPVHDALQASEAPRVHDAAAVPEAPPIYEAPVYEPPAYEPKVYEPPVQDAQPVQQASPVDRLPPAEAAPAPAPPPPASLADAFTALLAAEQGLPAPPPGFRAPAPVAVDEDVIAQIVRRVLSELTDRVVRETAAEIVSAVAERLVREEIERIKAAVKP